MIVVSLNADVYEIKFPYDPVIVSMVKNVPGKIWHSESKMWTVPKDKLGWLLNEFKGTRYEHIVQIISEEDINVNQTLDVTNVIPDIDISRIPYYVKEGAKPYQHQLDFMKYAIHRQLTGNMNGFLVADEPGLAKTNESMNLAIYNKKQYGYKHCLVICCINTSKYNWRDDIGEHTEGEYQPYILGSRLKKNGEVKSEIASADKLEDITTMKMYGGDDPLPYFIITNIESFRSDAGKKFSAALIAAINRGDISMIIVDEVHKNMSASSSQGKNITKVQEATKGKVMWIPMTGTPITNKPLDLYLPMKLIQTHRYNSYWLWSHQFAIFGQYSGEILGYKNMPRLKSMLQSNMIRRLKKDVLDLPEKIYYTEYVENTAVQKKLYAQIAGDLKKQRDEIVTAINPLARFMKLRQVNGSPELVEPMPIDTQYFKNNAKLQRLMSLLEEIHERGEKTLIFSNWVEPLRTLYKFIAPKYKVCCFTGTMSEADRQKHKQVFQSNPEYTVMIGTIAAMGTTHTLTAATNVIFYDEPWTPSDKEQAEDRAHRIGSTQPINIYTLITAGTIDERVHNVLYTKSGISKFIVDNLDIRKDPELFELLLGDSRNLRRN